MLSRTQPFRAVLSSSRLRAHAFAIYFAMIAMLGTILVYRATPMSGIDEMFHFKRALQVSQLDLLPRTLGPNDWGGKLDRHMLDYERWFDDRRNAHIRVGIASAREAEAAIRQEPTGRRMDHFPSTASYSPLPYVPAAIGLGLARGFHADPSTTMYAGRLSSLFGYMLLLGCVVAMLPVGRFGALAILSTPTAIHLASSFSADPVTNTVGALFAACCVRLRVSNEARFGALGKSSLVVLAMLVGLLKLTCGLLGFLALILPGTLFRSRRQAWCFRLGCIAACAGTALAWNMSYPFVPGPYWNSGADPRLSMHMILTAPVQQAFVVLGNIRVHAYFWWVDGYSRFCTGPMPFYYLFNGASAVIGLAVIGGLCLCEPRLRTSPVSGLLFVAVAVAYYLEVLVAFKVGFSPPNSWDITGLQGRYFLLPLAVAYLGLSMALPRRLALPCAVVPLFALYAVQTIRLVTALLGAYAPEWF